MNSDQLDLWEGSEVQGLDLATLPWSGRSPRGLTQVALSGIFKAQADKSLSDFVCAAQGDLWLISPKNAPGFYSGAPLLMDLPRRI